MNDRDQIIATLKSGAWAFRQEAIEARERGDRDGEIHCNGIAEGLDIAWRGIQAQRIEQRHLRLVT